MPDVKLGDVFHYARIIPGCKIFENLKLKVRYIHGDYFSAVDLKDGHTYPFHKNLIGKCLFKDPFVAEKIVDAASEKYPSIPLETEYEEFEQF